MAINCTHIIFYWSTHLVAVNECNQKNKNKKYKSFPQIKQKKIVFVFFSSDNIYMQ